MIFFRIYGNGEGEDSLVASLPIYHIVHDMTNLGEQVTEHIFFYCEHGIQYITGG